MYRGRRPRPHLLALCAALALAGCEVESGASTSTAGPFVERDASGTSTAGPFAEPVRQAPDGEALFPDLRGAALLDAVGDAYRPARTLGYGRARDALFPYEQGAAGALCGVYTDFCITLPPDADPSSAAAALGINTEHVWPQSYGARDEPLRSDMHHLFPSRNPVNSARGNLPFGEVSDEQARAWYRGDRSQSRVPRADLDAWSERSADRFEPREDRKGDIARAVFYVYAVYRPTEDDADGYFAAQRADLLAWHAADPVSPHEAARSAWIATQQGNENPFVLDPTLASRAFGGSSRAAPPRPRASDRPALPSPRLAPPAAPRTAPRTAPGADLWVSEIHYDNVGEDIGEGVEIAGPPGARLDGWQLVLYNGAGGTVYDVHALSGTFDAAGARWINVPGLQNGGPDGLALVRPDGAVAAFLAYEGTFTAADGPAAGVRSEDIGAAQSGRAPANESVQRTGPGAPWGLRPSSPGRVR